MTGLPTWNFWGERGRCSERINDQYSIWLLTIPTQWLTSCASDYSDWIGSNTQLQSIQSNSRAAVLSIILMLKEDEESAQSAQSMTLTTRLPRTNMLKGLRCPWVNIWGGQVPSCFATISLISFQSRSSFRSGWFFGDKTITQPNVRVLNDLKRSESRPWPKYAEIGSKYPDTWFSCWHRGDFAVLLLYLNLVTIDEVKALDHHTQYHSAFKGKQQPEGPRMPTGTQYRFQELQAQPQGLSNTQPNRSRKQVGQQWPS